MAAKKTVSKAKTSSVSSSKKTTASKTSVAKKATGTALSAVEAKQVALARKVIEGDKIGLKILEEHIGQFPCIPTGCFAIDEIIGGMIVTNQDGTQGPKCPGYPRRRIVEIYGPEACGKTTVALTAVAQAQALGGRAMYLDFEHALDDTYAKKLGVDYDPNKLMRMAPNTMEQGFNALQVGVKTGFDLIVVDSVAALIPESEMKKGFSDSAAIGERARALSRYLPKLAVILDDLEQAPNVRGGTTLIFINQVRDKIGGMGWGDNETTPGGRALKFTASLRLRFSRGLSEKIKKKDPVTGKDRSYPYGVHTDIKIVKNKLAPTNGWASNFFIRFGEGIDEIHTLIECGALNGIVNKKSGWYAYRDQRFQGRDPFRKYLINNPSVLTEFREAVIAKLKNQNSSTEELDDEELTIVSEAASLEDSLDDFNDSNDEVVFDETD